VIVVLEPAPAGGRVDSAAVADAQISRHRGAVRRVYRSALSGYAATVPAQEVDALRAEPGVRSVELDQRVSGSGTQSPVPSWGLDRVDQRALPLSDSYTYGGAGAGVALYVVDSGVRLTHNEFAGRIRTGPDFVDGGPPDDCVGHGTHVAGTAAGTGFGVAKQATVVAVRVLDCDGSGWVSDTIAGVDWVSADHGSGGRAVGNASLGGNYSAAMNQAVTNSIADGVVWVVAAGNQDEDACRSSPASTPGAITVAASGRGDDRAWFSSYGSCVDVFAPGVDITSAGVSGDSAVAAETGTSMAAPHVAGAAARYIGQHPTATASQVSEALLSAATNGLVTDARSPNRLLYMAPGDDGPGTPPPPQCRVTGPVQGDIRDRYVALGGPCGFLGQPLTGELSTPGNVGRYNVFQGGSIYWSPASGAWEVHGGIRDQWGAVGWEGGPVGFPITNEMALPGGAFNAFQRGSIYWSPATGAHALWGDIRKTWGQLGWENSALGYPVTSELPTPGTPGAFNHFQSGSIYWSPATGAHEVRGLIRDEWARLGWEASSLRFPVSNEYAAPDGRRSDFQNGSMTWNSTTGVVVRINGE
jgi:subtilisin family serine protease